MVDGIGVGSSECFYHAPNSIESDEQRTFTEHYQDFHGADLIVVDGHGSYKKSESTEDGTRGSDYRMYPLYAVYGDKKLITSEVSEMTLTQYYELWKDKIILANKKPFILNGDIAN